MERIVHVTFGVHVSLDSRSQHGLPRYGACAMVRATDDSQRGYVVTVQRPSRWRMSKDGWLSGKVWVQSVWRVATP